MLKRTPRRDIPHHSRRLKLAVALLALGSFPVSDAYASGGSDVVRSVGCCVHGVATGLTMGIGAAIDATNDAMSAPDGDCTPDPSPEQARHQLAAIAVRSATTCRPTEPQPRTVDVNISFRAADGTAAAVWFDPPLRGPAYANCMSAAFYEARLDCFDGADATLIFSLRATGGT